MATLCCICLEDLRADAVCMTQCTHSLHAVCAFQLACSQAVREDGSGAGGLPCPLCRARGPAALEVVQRLMRDPTMSRRAVCEMARWAVGFADREATRLRPYPGLLEEVLAQKSRCLQNLSRMGGGEAPPSTIAA